MQVLLGRATEDVVVDIDLAREGRANKISRRQVGLLLFNLTYTINISSTTGTCHESGVHGGVTGYF